MPPSSRLVPLFLTLALLVLVPFLIWGDYFEAMFTWEGSRAWLDGFKSWAWLAGITLLVSDLFLPLPNTLIIAGLGWRYGILIGGLLGAAGSILSGLLAYWLCRRFGRGMALRFIGQGDLERAEQMFKKRGGWIVALSRWLPMLPEIIACSAGLARMPLRLYVLALACGNLPLGFVFAAIGHFGHENLPLATLLSLVIPPVLWLIVQTVSRRVAKWDDQVPPSRSEPS